MSDAKSLGIGTIITSEQAREAIHVAIIPMKAASDSKPGEWVRVTEDQAEVTNVGKFGGALADKEKVAVVDPFLKQNVRRGQRCWVFLKPGSITGMRHHWQHPAFAEDDLVLPDSKSTCEIKARCQDMDIGYDELMQAATRYQEYGDYWCQGDRFDGMGGLPNAFWPHWEKITGKRATDKSEYIFSCSC